MGCFSIRQDKGGIRGAKEEKTKNFAKQPGKIVQERRREKKRKKKRNSRGIRDGCNQTKKGPPGRKAHPGTQSPIKGYRPVGETVGKKESYRPRGHSEKGSGKKPCNSSKLATRWEERREEKKHRQKGNGMQVSPWQQCPKRGRKGT